MPHSTANLMFPLNGIPSVAASHDANEAANDIASLTAGIRNGDEAAFQEFHRRYFDRLYQFLLVVSSGREDEAREALQETFLRVIRYVRRFETEDTFWGWLRTVARSAARDGGRRRRRYLDLLQRFALAKGIAQGHPANSSNPLIDALEESLEELDPADRKMIEGKYIEGATVKELACASGSTDKAVESRLLRVRRTIRDLVLSKLRVLS